MERMWLLGSMLRRKEVEVTSEEEDVRGVLCQLSLLGFVHFASFAVARNWLLRCTVFLSLLHGCGTTPTEAGQFLLTGAWRQAPEPPALRSLSRAWAHLFLKTLANLHSWSLLDPGGADFPWLLRQLYFSRHSLVFLFFAFK